MLDRVDANPAWGGRDFGQLMLDGVDANPYQGAETLAIPVAYLEELPGKVVCRYGHPTNAGWGWRQSRRSAQVVSQSPVAWLALGGLKLWSFQSLS